MQKLSAFVLSVVLASAVLTDASNLCSSVSSCQERHVCWSLSIRSIADCRESEHSCVLGLCLVGGAAHGLANPKHWGRPTIAAVAGAVAGEDGSWSAVLKETNFTTGLHGCSTRSLNVSAVKLGILKATSTLDCASQGVVQLTEIWQAGTRGSLHWSTSVQSTHESLWTTSIGHAYLQKYTVEPNVWVPGAQRGAYPNSTFSPFEAVAASALPSEFKLGNEGDNPPPIVLGMAAVIDEQGDSALAFVHDPGASPYDADLSSESNVDIGDDRGQGLGLWWANNNFRLGQNTTAIELEQDILITAGEWRAAWGWVVEGYSDFFEPHVNTTEIEGPGSYAHYGQGFGYANTSTIPDDYADLGVRFVWDATFPYPSHGLFVPYNISADPPKPFSGNWTTCFGEGAPWSKKEPAPPCWQTSYEEWNAIYGKLRQQYGINTCVYANFWEYGFNVTDNSHELHCDSQELNDFERQYCFTNKPLRKKFNGSWLATWDRKSGKVDPIKEMHNGMGGSIVMDAGDPEYRKHLLMMVDIMLEHLPESVGICTDGSASWKKTSPKGDDGRTLDAGFPVRTQIGTFIETSAAIADKLHKHGKAFFWNPSQNRADMLHHFDGIFTELGYAMPSIHQNALLAVNKPMIMWNAGCYQARPWQPPISYSRPWQCAKKEWKQPTSPAEVVDMLQGSLLFGAYYVPPFPGGDHQAVPGDDDERNTFRRYKPLFELLVGKRWVLRARAIRALHVSDGRDRAQANIFSTLRGVLVPVVFGPPAAGVQLILGMSAPCGAQVYYANGTVATLRELTFHTRNLTIQFQLGAEGEALVLLPSRRECKADTVQLI